MLISSNSAVNRSRNLLTCCCPVMRPGHPFETIAAQEVWRHQAGGCALDANHVADTPPQVYGWYRWPQATQTPMTEQVENGQDMVQPLKSLWPVSHRVPGKPEDQAAATSFAQPEVVGSVLFGDGEATIPCSSRTRYEKTIQLAARNHKT